MSDHEHEGGDYAMGLAEDGASFVGLVIVTIVILIILTWGAFRLGLIHDQDPCADPDSAYCDYPEETP